MFANVFIMGSFILSMKKEVYVALAVVLFVLGVLMISESITGNVVGDSELMHDEMMGPSAEDMACLESCIAVGCGHEDRECMIANSKKCEEECGVEAEPEPEDEGEACMQKCVVRGCDERDFDCQSANMGKCESECGMIGEPKARNEEEQCIRDCISEVDPNIKCSHGTFEGEGETGNEVCQRCADKCEHLYSGPCLTDELWREKENECIAQCEHCYGEPVMGSSGEGYECTVDIKCADASGEFGDDAGTGDDSFEKGHEGPGIVASVGEAISETVGNVFEGIGNFFKGLFN